MECRAQRAMKMLFSGIAAAATTSAFVFNAQDSHEKNKRISGQKWADRPVNWRPKKITEMHPSPFLTVAYCEASIETQQLQEELPFKMEKSDSHYYERMTPPPRSEESSHVIFGQLLKPNLIERYHVYRRVNVHGKSNEIVVADVRFGTNLDGHNGIVHGGIISLLLDDAMGFAYEAMGISMAVTANLTVNFRNPVPAGVKAVVRVHNTRTEGRKVYFDAQVTSPDGSVLYAEGSSLYIIPRSGKQKDK